MTARILYSHGGPRRRATSRDKLGIELKTVNFAAEYWDEVFEVFLSEFKAGRTRIRYSVQQTC